MKALVAGGTGFIGSHIVRDLLSKGIQVRILVRQSKNIGSLTEEGIDFVHGDILKIDSLRKWIKDVDLVYSAFGVLGHWNIPEQAYWEINTTGVKNLLESCVNGHIKQFIHISSAGVLGPLPDGVVADESFPLNPSNIYERTKGEAEKEILKCGTELGFPFTIIRPEFVYGPGDMHVLGLFKAVGARRFFLLGRGESLLHPTYIDDLIQGISLCMDNEDAMGEVFLITGDKPLTVKELAGVMAEELDVPFPKLRVPLLFARSMAKALESGARLARFEPPLTVSQVKFFTQNRAFSFEKARKVLGYTPIISFREGVRRTIHWYRENNYL